jgi:hypothetical protein
MDDRSNLRYVQVTVATVGVTTMALNKSMNVEPEILLKTRCDQNFACLSDESACNAEPYLDRDVQLLRCRDERSCAYKKKYMGLFICSCPANKAAFGIN